MKERLSEHRFKHTDSVKNTTLRIFDSIKDKLQLEDQKQIITEDSFRERLKLAAILHDCCKELSNEDQIELANFYSIEIHKEDKEAPNLLHARVGAKWVEEEYEILDPQILKAIEDHTLGSENMLLSSKILFLADMIEPERRASKDLEEIRSLVYSQASLDEALLLAMEKKIIYVINKGLKVHPLAIKARNSFLEKLKS